MTPTSLFDFPSVKKYLMRIDAEPRSLFVAVKKETVGTYWQEVAKIRFTKDGTVDAPVGYEPTEGERALIKTELSAADWPKFAFPDNLNALPEHVRNAPKDDLFVFYDEHNRIIMVQLRVQTDKGKNYIPYSYWSDGRWRPTEPDMEDGKLPLYGIETLKGNTTAFISEGAKTARAINRIINPKTPEDHRLAEEFPWREQFKHAGSVGFVGGALSPHRTDWSILKKLGIQRVIIISDNDQPGVEAVPKISDAVNLPAVAIKFSDEWPVAWDMADPWPEHFFKRIGERRYYIGPSFFDCVVPATYMTYVIDYIDDNGKLRKAYHLRHYAKNQWSFIEHQNIFVHNDFPHIQGDAETIDRLLLPFSHTKKTSELLLQEYPNRMRTLAYRPDIQKRRVIVDGDMCFNTFRPGNFSPREGDPEPFLEFMRFLFPIEEECNEVLRWCATLLAKPDVRMIYGLLLISEQTGVGKTLLCETVLAPLVGMHNTSFPNETTIMEPYTAWLAQKRLTVIGEIYQGHSFKMANKLKQYITDSKITYRVMHVTPAVMDNFCHFIACSNSMTALKMDERERRWYVPTVAEVRWPDEKYTAFIEWLHSGGLSIILNWAHGFGNYVKRGEKAPSTSRKLEIIEDGKSKAMVRTEEIAGIIRDSSEPIALGDKDLLGWLEAITKDRVHEKPGELRKIAIKAGLYDGKQGGLERMSHNNQLQNFILNKKAVDMLARTSESERKSAVKTIAKRPNELMEYEP